MQTLEHNGRCVWTGGDALTDCQMDPTMRVAFQQLARIFIEWAGNQGFTAEPLSVQARDAAVMPFWLGAASAALVTGQSDLAQAIAKIGVLEISKRGYAAVAALAL